MTDRHEHLDEGTIHAWLDGALPPDESARIERLAGACPECAALVAEARGLMAASSRILSSLDAVPGGVIPGADAGTDQLAALRERRRETSRRWWNDRRILAAASLVFIAGVSTLVLRDAGIEVRSQAVQQAAQLARPEADSAIATVVAPPPATSPAVPSGARSPSARGAKASEPSSLRDAAPVTVAEKRSVDLAADPKVSGAIASSPARDRAVAENESRRADSSIATLTRQMADSLSVAQRAAQRSAFQVQLQQGAATQNPQANRMRAEQTRPNAPPLALGAGSRLGSVVTTGVAAAPAAGIATVVGACYELHPWTPDARAVSAPDRVTFLGTVAEAPDSTWRVAQSRVSHLATIVWTLVDSVTVEVRRLDEPYTIRARFRTDGRVPDVRDVSGVLATVGRKVSCQ